MADIEACRLIGTKRDRSPADPDNGSLEGAQQLASHSSTAVLLHHANESKRRVPTVAREPERRSDATLRGLRNEEEIALGGKRRAQLSVPGLVRPIDHRIELLASEVERVGELLERNDGSDCDGQDRLLQSWAAKPEGVRQLGESMSACVSLRVDPSQPRIDDIGSRVVEEPPDVSQANAGLSQQSDPRRSHQLLPAVPPITIQWVNDSRNEQSASLVEP